MRQIGRSAPNASARAGELAPASSGEKVDEEKAGHLWFDCDGAAYNHRSTHWCWRSRCAGEHQKQSDNISGMIAQKRKRRQKAESHQEGKGCRHSCKAVGSPTTGIALLRRTTGNRSCLDSHSAPGRCLRKQARGLRAHTAALGRTANGSIGISNSCVLHGSGLVGLATIAVR